MVALLDRIKKLEERRVILALRDRPSMQAIAARVGHLIDTCRAPFATGSRRQIRASRIAEILELAQLRASTSNALWLGEFA